MSTLFKFKHRIETQKEKDAFKAALKNLEALLTPQSQFDQQIIRHLEEIIDQTKTLRGKEKTSDLTEALVAAHGRLTNPKEYSHEECQAVANKMQGKPSKGLQRLGLALISLSIVLLLAWCIAPAVIGAAAIVGTLGKGGMIAAMFLSTFGIEVSGAALFVSGNKQTGLSKSLSELNNDASKLEGPVPTVQAEISPTDLDIKTTPIQNSFNPGQGF